MQLEKKLSEGLIRKTSYDGSSTLAEIEGFPILTRNVLDNQSLTSGMHPTFEGVNRLLVQSNQCKPHHALFHERPTNH